LDGRRHPAEVVLAVVVVARGAVHGGAVVGARAPVRAARAVAEADAAARGAGRLERWIAHVADADGLNDEAAVGGDTMVIGRADDGAQRVGDGSTVVAAAAAAACACERRGESDEDSLRHDRLLEAVP